MQNIIAMQRYATLVTVAILTVICLIVAMWETWVFVPAIIFGALTLLGLRDISQTRHAVLKNYPVLGHIRFLFEKSVRKSGSI